MTREEHLRAIRIVGLVKRGKHNVLLMLCSGPECGGAEMLAVPNAWAVAGAADAHLDVTGLT